MGKTGGVVLPIVCVWWLYAVFEDFVYYAWVEEGGGVANAVWFVFGYFAQYAAHYFTATGFG